LGAPGDVPAAGDYDYDGVADFVIQRPSAQALWLSLSTAPDAIYVDHLGIAGNFELFAQPGLTAFAPDVTAAVAPATANAAPGARTVTNTKKPKHPWRKKLIPR
jgi:hypothetical protein